MKDPIPIKASYITGIILANLGSSYGYDTKGRLGTHMPPVIATQTDLLCWERLNLDYLDPFKGKMYLIIVDAHSEWMEVFEISCTSTKQLLKTPVQYTS